MSIYQQIIDNIHPLIQKLEEDAALIYSIRSIAKKDNGRLTPSGVDMIRIYVSGGMTQSNVAKLLDIDKSAVSQRLKEK